MSLAGIVIHPNRMMNNITVNHSNPQRRASELQTIVKADRIDSVCLNRDLGINAIFGTSASGSRNRLVEQLAVKLGKDGRGEYRGAVVITGHDRAAVARKLREHVIKAWPTNHASTFCKLLDS